MQHRPGRAFLAGLVVGLFQLAENLRLAQHQRIQPAGHTQQVAHDILLLVGVEPVAHVGIVAGAFSFQPVDDDIRRGGVDVAVDFGAIAGRQDDGFFDRRERGDAGQRVIELAGAEGQFLADRDGCGLVIYAEREKRHVERPSP